MAASPASENGPLRIRDVPETLGASGFGMGHPWMDLFSPWRKLGGGNSNMFLFYPYFGENSKFDEHIFQLGWNHQAANVFRNASQN